MRYRTHGDPLRVTVCHCTWCQRRTGSAFAVNAVFAFNTGVAFSAGVAEQRFELVGQAPRVHRHLSDESGRWLDQHFCASCGTSVGFTLEWVSGVFAVAAGTFDEPRWLSPHEHDFRYIYLRSAQCWSALPEGVLRYEKHFRT